MQAIRKVSPPPMASFTFFCRELGQRWGCLLVFLEVESSLDAKGRSERARRLPNACFRHALFIDTYLYLRKCLNLAFAQVWFSVYDVP